MHRLYRMKYLAGLAYGRSAMRMLLLYRPVLTYRRLNGKVD